MGIQGDQHSKSSQRKLSGREESYTEKELFRFVESPLKASGKNLTVKPSRATTQSQRKNHSQGMEKTLSTAHVEPRTVCAPTYRVKIPHNVSDIGQSIQKGTYFSEKEKD